MRQRQQLHQHLRHQGHSAEHDQVPRGVHGRAHRPRLLPHLPSAQMRDGCGLAGQHGVGVRVGGAAMTLAILAGATVPLITPGEWSHRSRTATSGEQAQALVSHEPELH